MILVLRNCCISIGLLFLSIHLHAQVLDPALPKLFPSHIEALKAEEYIQNYCVQNVFLDSLGRMWMATCGVTAFPYQMFLAQHDGYSFDPIDIGFPDEMNSHTNTAWGYHPKHGIYGLSIDREKGNYLFTYHLHSKILKLTPLGTVYPAGIAVDKNDFWLITNDGNQKLNISRWDGVQVRRIYQETLPSNFEFVFDYKKDNNNLFKKGDFLFYYKPPFGLYRYHIPQKKGNWIFHFNSTESTSTCTTENNYHSSNIVVQNDQLHFLSKDANKLAFYQSPFPNLNTFRPNPMLPDCIQYGGLFQDQGGNILFIFLAEDGTQEALLLDTRGQSWNYSPMLEGI